MIEFMLLAAPRSATAWCANWLTTDETLCLHEPLYTQTHEQLDARPGRIGIACTVTPLLNMNRHPARKVVLHRDPKEVRESMARLGIPGDYDFNALDNIEGRHHDWREVFDNPRGIYEYLLQQPFDEDRHASLRGLNVQNTHLIQSLQMGAYAPRHA